MKAVLDGVEFERVERIEPGHLPENLLTVAVFGPGHGEAVVVGLPDRRVGVLDGCAGPGDPVSALLDRVITERPALRIAFVGLTHPHDDHYAGLGALLERFDAHIEACWESPLTQRHAKALVQIMKLGEEEGAYPSALHSLELVLDRIKAFADGPRGDSYSTFSHNKVLLEHPDGPGPALTVRACGPHDADERHATLDLAAAARALAGEGSSRRGIDPNLMSGAVLVEWGKARALLGGDLLAATGKFRGWSAVRGLPWLKSRQIQVVKAAHHASEGAHDHELWSLITPSLVLVTPFREAFTTVTGTKNPPRPEHTGALARKSVVAISSPPRWSAESTGERSSALGETTAARRRSALQNAIAVSLDSEGKIVKLVLAGEANLYEGIPTEVG